MATELGDAESFSSREDPSLKQVWFDEFIKRKPVPVNEKENKIQVNCTRWHPYLTVVF